MKDIRFYEEFKNKRKGISAGNVFAAFKMPADYASGDPYRSRYDGLCFGSAAIFDEPNSPVAGTGVSREFLVKKCKRISEARAREIHPLLFEMHLDRE